MKVSATEFKAKCLKLMDQVQKTHDPVIITKRGAPVAKLVPAEPEESKSWFGCMAGTIEIAEDITAPMDEDWEAYLGEGAHFYEGLSETEPNPDKKK